jgi:hypothetical protein
MRLFGTRMPLVLTGLAIVVIFAVGFFVALGVRSVVAGPDSAPAAAPPNPGHSWSDIGDLPGTMWHSNNDGPASGLDGDTVDGAEASALEESTEIDADIGTHTADPSAHHTKTTDAADITSGTMTPARIEGTAWTSLNDGPGSGLDADSVDGLDSSEMGGLSNVVSAESNAQVSRSGAFPWEDLPVTASITTTGGDVLVVFNAGMWKESGHPDLFFRARLDSQYSSASYWEGISNYRLPPINLTILFEDVAAGTHTVAIQWSSLTGNVTTAGYYPDQNYYRLFAAEVN